MNLHDFDRFDCPKCHGDFKIVVVEDRETGHQGYALECSRCEYLDYNDQRLKKVIGKLNAESSKIFGGV